MPIASPTRLRRGAILLMALFVMVVASLLALSLAYRASLISRLARDTLIRLQLRAHAESAAALALAELAADRNPFDHYAESWNEPSLVALGDWTPPWLPTPDGRPPEFSLACRVRDEDSKLSVLHASESDLEALGLPAPQIAALFDWMDADSIARPAGAETDFYAHLPRPYACKDTPLESLDELLLIRGFGLRDYLPPPSPAAPRSSPHPAISGAAPPALIDLLTVWTDGRVNLNTAPPAVLQTLPISDQAVQQILAYRAFNPDGGGTLEDHAFQSDSDLDQLQGLSPYERQALKGLSVFDSRVFRIVADSRHTRTGQTYRLAACVRQTQDGLEVLQWRTEQ